MRNRASPYLSSRSLRWRQLTPFDSVVLQVILFDGHLIKDGIQWPRKVSLKERRSWRCTVSMAANGGAVKDSRNRILSNLVLVALIPTCFQLLLKRWIGAMDANGRCWVRAIAHLPFKDAP